jgi:hypothetical protein
VTCSCRRRYRGSTTVCAKMDFSEAYRFSACPPVFSSNGKYVACAVDARCVVRDADSLTVCQIFSCQDKIDCLDWSPNSKHVLCSMHSRAIAQIWNIEEECWTCKIDEGPAGVVLDATVCLPHMQLLACIDCSPSAPHDQQPPRDERACCIVAAGLASARWSSTGMEVVMVADFQIRMAVWDLAGQSCRHRTGPKFSGNGIQFSRDGRYLAVAEVCMTRRHIRR